jgi:hypothetical protein
MHKKDGVKQALDRFTRYFLKCHYFPKEKCSLVQTLACT